MPIVLFGTPEFALPTFQRLYQEGEEIALVVTQPDRPSGRGHTLKQPPVKEWAMGMGLRVLQPERLRNGAVLQVIREINPEFAIVVAYGKIIPPELLEVTTFINLHASLLPKYRGAAPIQWAIIRGEKETGVTTMLMDEGLDTGDILLQKRVPIQEDDDALSLSQRLSIEGAELMVETLKGLRSGRITPHPQVGEPSYAPPIRKSDGHINWNIPAVQIRNLVRGLYPWPSAYTFLDGRMLKILRADVVEGEGPPGVVVKRTKTELLVGTSDGLLSILVLQVEGKRVMTVKEFLQGAGRGINEGQRFS